MENIRILYAQFLNDGSSLAISMMTPIWNGSPNSAYSLAVDAAGILERITMHSNDYISGDEKKEAKFADYFKQNIEALRKDRRFANNSQVQDFCTKYLNLLNSMIQTEVL